MLCARGKLVSIDFVFNMQNAENFVCIYGHSESISYLSTVVSYLLEIGAIGIK